MYHPLYIQYYPLYIQYYPYIFSITPCIFSTTPCIFSITPCIFSITPIYSVLPPVYSVLPPVYSVLPPVYSVLLPVYLVLPLYIYCSFSVAQKPNLSLGRLVIEVSRSHKHAHMHTPGRNSLNERSARRRGRYLHNTQQTQKTNIHALSGIRTRNVSDRAGADYALDRGICIFSITPLYSVLPHLYSLLPLCIQYYPCMFIITHVHSVLPLYV